MADVALNFSAVTRPASLPRVTPGLLVNHVGSAGDTEPPKVTQLTPPNGATISPDQAITIAVTDNVALRRLFITARFPGVAVEEMVFNGQRFAANYAAQSTFQTAPDQQGKPRTTLTVRRTGGWPADSVTWDVIPIDTGGNEGIT